MKLNQRIRQLEQSYDFAIFNDVYLAYLVEETIVFVAYDHDDQFYFVAEIGDFEYSSIPQELGSIDDCIAYIESNYNYSHKEDYRIKKTG